MEKRGYGQKILNTTIDNNSVKRSEGVKDLEKKGFKEPRGRKGEGVKDSRIWKRKGSRSQGFEGSSGSLGNLILKIKKPFERQRGSSGKR